MVATWDPDPELTPEQRAEYERLVSTREHTSMRGGLPGRCTYCGRMTDFWPWGTHNLAACRICFVRIGSPGGPEAPIRITAEELLPPRAAAGRRR